MGHMGPMMDYGFSRGFGMFSIIPIIMFLIWLVFLGLSLYVMVLVIRALKKYINKES